MVVRSTGSPVRWIASALLALLAGAAGASPGERIVDNLAYTAPSALVAVENGRRLNLYCSGSGSPTALFDSGLGDGTKSWGYLGGGPGLHVHDTEEAHVLDPGRAQSPGPCLGQPTRLAPLQGGEVRPPAAGA